MNKYKNTDKDIHTRIYKFILTSFEIVKLIGKSSANNRIIDQLVGSLTSMGANDQEAEVASSKKDFIQKYSIVRKEAKETYYWLRLITDLKLVNKNIDQDLQECKEILRVVSAIILKSKLTLKISNL